MNPDLLKEMPPDLFPGVIYIYDIQDKGNFYMNSKFKDILGYTQEEIQSMGAGIVASLIHPDDKNRVEEETSQLTKIKPGSAVRTEYRLKDKSGTWRWFADCSCVTQVDEAGAAKQIIGTALEITESKNASLHIDKIYSLFQFVLDKIPLSVSWKDLEGAYLGYNKEFLKEAGLGADIEAMGKSDFELPWKDTDAKSNQQADQAVCKDGKAHCDVIEKQQQKDGRDLILNSNRYPIKDDDGDIVGVLCTREDVTDNTLYSQALKALEQRYQLLLETTDEAVFIISAENGSVLEINDVAVALSGYSRTELIGQPHTLIQPISKLDDYIAWFSDCILSGGRSKAEQIICCKNGEEIPVSVFATVFEIDGASILRCNYLDISNHKSSVIRLQELCDGYRNVIEDSAEMVIQLNQDYSVIQANSACRDFAGSARQNEAEASFLAVVRASDKDFFDKKLRALTPEAAIAKFDLVLITSDGTEEACNVNALATFDAAGQSLEYQLVIAAPHDAEKKNDKLQQQIKELEQTHRAVTKGAEKEFQNQLAQLNKKINSFGDKDKASDSKLKDAKSELKSLKQKKCFIRQ